MNEAKLQELFEIATSERIFDKAARDNAIRQLATHFASSASSASSAASDFDEHFGLSYAIAENLACNLREDAAHLHSFASAVNSEINRHFKR